MGSKKQYLVVMTNNDAYHVSQYDVDGILYKLAHDKHHTATDLKLNTRVTIVLAHISSIVELKGRSNGS